MNWNDSQHDPLDELLSAAHWPEPRAEQIDRLEREWGRMVRRRKRRVLVTSLAAGLLVPIGALVGVLFVGGDHPRGDVAKVESQSVLPDAESAWPNAGVLPDAESDVGTESIYRPEAAVLAAPPQPQKQQVRDPNAFEQTLVLMHRRRLKPQQPIVKQPTVTQPVVPVKTIESNVEQLFAAMYSSRIDTRLAAASRLSKLNDPQVSKRLAQMALEGSVRREALIALLQSSDKVANQFLAYAETDETLAPSLRALTANRARSDQIY
jgi:hypothetical protein